MRQLLAAAIVTVLAAAPAALAAPDFAGMQVTPYDPPKPAPAFALPDLGGTTHRLEETRGKVAILFFWATW
jgi:cytochrome c biogenesis protein CcmG/thiol:disulfide interchange protein DsbE